MTDLDNLYLAQGTVSIALVAPPVGLCVLICGVSYKVLRGTCADCHDRQEPPPAFRQVSTCLNRERYDHRLYLIRAEKS